MERLAGELAASKKRIFTLEDNVTYEKTTQTVQTDPWESNDGGHRHHVTEEEEDGMDTAAEAAKEEEAAAAQEEVSQEDEVVARGALRCIPFRTQPPEGFGMSVRHPHLVQARLPLVYRPTLLDGSCRNADGRRSQCHFFSIHVDFHWTQILHIVSPAPHPPRICNYRSPIVW